LGEITMDLRLVFRIPESDLTINGLIQGLKESCSKIHVTILSTLMQALEERIIEDMIDTAPGRYVRNGHQRRPRQLKCFWEPFIIALPNSQIGRKKLQ